MLFARVWSNQLMICFGVWKLCCQMCPVTMGTQSFHRVCKLCFTRRSCQKKVLVSFDRFLHEWELQRWSKLLWELLLVKAKCIICQDLDARGGRIEETGFSLSFSAEKCVQIWGKSKIRPKNEAAMQKLWHSEFWSLSQLPFDKGVVHPGKIPSLSQDHTYAHITNRKFRVTN